MTKSEIRDKIAEITALPSASSAVIRSVRDPNIDASRLKRNIELDPSLTCNILKLANVSTASKIRSIRDVVEKVGLQKLFQLANASMVDPRCRRQARGYNLPPGELWRHAVHVALGVVELADILKVRQTDHGFTAALLHDIGKTVLGNFFKPDVKKITNYAIANLTTYSDAEKKILGAAHGEVGAMLLEQWNLPRELVESVRDHHNPPSRKPNPVTDLIHIVDSCLEMKDDGAAIDGLRYHRSNEAANRLGFTTRVRVELAARIEEATAQIQNLMDLAGN